MNFKWKKFQINKYHSAHFSLFFKISSFLLSRNILFYFGCTGSSCPGARGLLLRWLLLLQSTGSRRVGFSSWSSCALEASLRSWHTRASLPRAWNLPGPGDPTHVPGPASRFSATGPPGKTSPICVLSSFSWYFLGVSSVKQATSRPRKERRMWSVSLHKAAVVGLWPASMSTGTVSQLLGSYPEPARAETLHCGFRQSVLEVLRWFHYIQVY